jgi:hypothetical protein
MRDFAYHVGYLMCVDKAREPMYIQPSIDRVHLYSNFAYE